MSDLATPAEGFVTIGTDQPIWDRFFTSASQVVIGTGEDAGYDFAPEQPRHRSLPFPAGFTR